MQKVLATYFERWRFRHPAPDDFFAVLREVSGQDLTWFIDEAYRSSTTFDYALQDLQSDRLPDGRYRTTVVARRHGEATFPVEVVTRFEGGAQVVERWDGRERRAIFRYERAERAASAAVDPRRVLVLDVNYTNNSPTRTPHASAASLKGALVWMVWLQQLMLSYGFFA
jgi:aminopeptidase N